MIGKIPKDNMLSLIVKILVFTSIFNFSHHCFAFPIQSIQKDSNSSDDPKPEIYICQVCESVRYGMDIFNGRTTFWEFVPA